jgi:hypothetical protein
MDVFCNPGKLFNCEHIPDFVSLHPGYILVLTELIILRALRFLRLI